MLRPKDLTIEACMVLLGEVQDALYLEYELWPADHEGPSAGRWVYTQDKPIDEQTIQVLRDVMRTFGAAPVGNVELED